MKKAGLLCLFLFMILALSQIARSQSLEDYIVQGGEKYNTSDFRGALKDWEQGLALAKGTNNDKAISTFLTSIGLVYWNLGDYPKALSYYDQALKIRKEIGDKNGEGTALNNIGLVYWNLGDYPKALSYYDQALKIRKEVKDKNGEGITLNNIGNVYRELGDYPKALSYYDQALKIRKEIGDKNGEGTTLNNIGNVYRESGEYPKALSFYDQALKIKKEIGDKNIEGTILNNIGNVYRELGDYPKTLSFYDQALKIRKEIGDKNGEGTTLSNIGLVYWNLDDYPKALSYYEQALKIRKKIGDKNGEGATLNNIGLVYWNLGDYLKALSYYDQALKIRKDVGNKNGEGITLNNIANVYRELGDYSKALSYYDQAFKIRKEIGDKNGEGTTLNNIGSVYRDLDDYAKALSYYQEALKIRREIGVPTRWTELNIGDTYLDQGNLTEALEIFNRLKDPICLGRYYLKTKDYLKAREEFARDLERIEGREMPNAASLLADYIGLGLADEGWQEYSRAKEYFKKGIDLIEKQRGALGGAERERFFEAKVMGFSRMEPYEGMVRVLIKEKGKGYEKEAFSYVERAKSRIFLELLANRDLGGRRQEDQAVLGQEKTFQQDMLVLKNRMEAMEKLGDKAPEGEMKRLKESYEAKEAEYERFIKEVKLTNAELASLISVNPTSGEAIQSLLDADTSLVEYYITSDKTYAWVLAKNDIKVYEIPLNEEELKDKVDAFLLPNISNLSRKAGPVITMAIGQENKKETPETEREDNRQRFHKEAVAFYQSIFAPLEKEIKTGKLIIVPHGVLHKVPFATLSDGSKYLIDRYALSVLPAASVMEYVVKKRKPDKDRLVTLANPQTDYLPLGFAEKEGQVLAAMFPQNETYYREKATETLAKKKASEFNIIHFASHGEFNDRQPMQSGLLLAKDDENDGYLQVHEIFGLDLKNANLVTLSACETALSKIQGGDDLVGLSRGFIYAGSPSLLATLWKVDDASTAKLMELFYKNWRQGMSKPEALRQAQLTLKSMPQYWHPFYWAPFVMIGDWR